VSDLQVRWSDAQQTPLFRAKAGIHSRWVPAFAGTSGSEGLQTYRRPRAVVATGRAAAKKFFGNRGTPREVAHWCWRNELYDPLSSFVPELEPRRRRGFSFGRGLTGASRSLTESAPSPSGAGYRGQWLWARPRSRRVTGIEVGRSFLFALFRHHRGARAALLTAPAEPLLRDVVLARPAIFPSLTNEGLLANGLSHSHRPL
jgi:hypothetical protein